MELGSNYALEFPFESLTPTAYTLTDGAPYVTTYIEASSMNIGNLIISLTVDK